MAELKIRLAQEADCPAINDIYNYYVLQSTCTYQIDPEPIHGRLEWLASHGTSHPVTVAEWDGIVVGWGALSPFHKRAAYARTVENAVYLHHEYRGRGIGKSILLDLIERAKVLNHHTIIALVSGEQGSSLKLHENLGFSRVGLLKAAGFKMGQWLDVVYLQKML